MSSCYTVIMDGQVRRIPDNQAFELANITTAARRRRTHISRRSGRKTACVGHITYVATLEGSSPIGCISSTSLEDAPRDRGPVGQALRLLDPLIKRLCRAADLRGNRSHRRPPRGMIFLVLENQPNRARAHFRRKSVPVLVVKKYANAFQTKVRSREYLLTRISISRPSARARVLKLSKSLMILWKSIRED
jgi:hypothetical protein